MRSGLSFVAKLGVLVALASALGACHRGRILSSCRDPASYQEARSVAPLKYPPGLSAATSTTALKLPDLNAPERPPRSAAEGCLDEPPQFVAPKTPIPQA